MLRCRTTGQLQIPFVYLYLCAVLSQSHASSLCTRCEERSIATGKRVKDNEMRKEKEREGEIVGESTLEANPFSVSLFARMKLHLNELPRHLSLRLRVSCLLLLSRVHYDWLGDRSMECETVSRCLLMRLHHCKHCHIELASSGFNFIRRGPGSLLLLLNLLSFLLTSASSLWMVESLNMN